MNKLLQILTIIGKILNLAGFASGYFDAKTAVIIHMAVSIGQNAVEQIGDLADDGQMNKSFKP